MTGVDICVQSFFFHTCSYVVTIISGFNTNKPFKMPTKHLSEFNTTCPIYLMTCLGQCREAKHVQILHEIYRVVLTMAQCWKVHLGLEQRYFWYKRVSVCQVSLFFTSVLNRGEELRDLKSDLLNERPYCSFLVSNIKRYPSEGWAGHKTWVWY